MSTGALNWLAGVVIETAFRAIPQWLGRPVTAAYPWLAGPIGTGGQIGPDYCVGLARELGLVVDESPDAGLLPDFERLRGPHFDPTAVDSRIRHFYEHTAAYTLAVTATWSPLFRPFARVLVATVSRRIAQLNFPLDARETAAGMTSQVLPLRDPAADRVAYTGWLRTQGGSGHVVYLGLYGTEHPPGESGPCVRVVFPLPAGNSTVLLRPSSGPGGTFRLSSDGRRFGQAGYYRLHQDAAGVRRARYVLALKETFDLWVDGRGVVHTDHWVRFFRLPILRLHYVLNRTRPDGDSAPAQG